MMVHAGLFCRAQTLARIKGTRSPDYRNETMRKAKGGNNPKTAHQSQWQMIKKSTKTNGIFGSFYHFCSCYGLRMCIIALLYGAVVCFSTIIKITSILSSPVLLLLLLLFLFFEAAYFYDCITRAYAKNHIRYFYLRIQLYTCLLWY